ncbi:hypothetical protein BASA50_010212 [Batrachochytrium salamandrivorans]|uniref:Protein CASP n=1 Tax=Batrachochytrium salamandrivorans TaxID=1357716 RepID=A0ABQ8F273_9FUNG|nr:hypothetical protein BASA62_006860 [Batrachochytrium salamandrivorans]KAH6579189.1 hypothetical protein BASA61_010386 [Batrachochytrium salamandrivorans]KAH6589169.1 hypothetical protein BASA50_010212 [Batrachochytrium salamandrivorans]
MYDRPAAYGLTCLEVGLPQLQRELDSQGLSIIENQNQSTSSRKRLADLTKEFKKIPDEDKLSEIKILLKEIDSMTKRSKFAEASFLSLYKLLSDAPDPAVLISSALELSKQAAQATIIQTENRHLRDDLAASNTQVAALKNTDSTILSLKQRLTRYEAMLDEMVAEKVAHKEHEMKQIMDDKIRMYKETEHALNRQLNHMMEQVSSLQNTHDVSQARMVDHTQKYDESVTARLAELDIVLMDLERANTKVAQLGSENRLLREKMNASTDVSENTQKVTQLQEHIQSIEAENSSLLEKLDLLTTAQRQLDISSNQNLQEQERQLAMKSFEIAELKVRVAEFSDYDGIKKELDIIKGIEFDGFVDSDVSSSVVDHPLEKLALAKNKKLQNDVMTLKAELFEVTSALQETTMARTDMEMRLAESKSLVEKLEADLLGLNQSWPISPQRATPLVQGLEAVMLDSSGNPNYSGGSMGGTGTSETPKATTEASIMTILTSQRDRYKSRFEEVEQMMREHTHTISNLRYEISNLKADNVKLYEKLRYAESYSVNKNSSGSTSHRNSSQVGISIDPQNSRFTGQDNISSKYSGMYEESLDPFRRFHKQEEQRKFHSMNPAERAALGFTRLLSTNKYSRWIFVFYSGALHLLVFFTLFQLSLSDCSQAKSKDLWTVQQSEMGSHS